jgi:hypothetical protein
MTAGETTLDTTSITTAPTESPLVAHGIAATVPLDGTLLGSGAARSQSGSDAAVPLNADNLASSSHTANSTFAGDNGVHTITGVLAITTPNGGNGSDLFAHLMSHDNATVQTNAGASWIDLINHNDGATMLGTHGTDWTVAITSGSSLPSDPTSHPVQTLHDTGSTNHIPDGVNTTFTEIEHHFMNR